MAEGLHLSAVYFNIACRITFRRSRTSYAGGKAATICGDHAAVDDDMTAAAATIVAAAYASRIVSTFDSDGAAVDDERAHFLGTDTGIVRIAIIYIERTGAVDGQVGTFVVAHLYALLGVKSGALAEG